MSVPSGWMPVWSDEFTGLSLRSGGPGAAGQLATSATGVWSASDQNDARGQAGYGYDWFIDPANPGWPAEYTGQFAITSDGFRVRAEPGDASVTSLLPQVRGQTPWLSGQLFSYYGVRIAPPFYVEFMAKMPVGNGNTWPALWLVSKSNQNFEIDIHEGFGDSTTLSSTLHWNTAQNTSDYPQQVVVSKAAGVDLSAGFNKWGCLVLTDTIVFYFNDVEQGRSAAPASSVLNQPFGIIMDLSAGLPYESALPSGGAHDMTVRYVRLYAPNTVNLTVDL